MWNKIKQRFTYKDVLQNKETFSNIDEYTCRPEVVCADVELVSSMSSAGENLMKDVEMFVNFDGNEEATVFDTFERNLQGTSILLKKLLATPITDIKTLETRQQIIKGYEENIETLSEKIARLKALEKDVLWLFVEKDDNLKHLFDIIYFKWMFLNKLNDRPEALTSTIFYKIVLSPFVGIMSPIIYYIVPYLVLYYKFGFKMSFTQYVRIMFQTLTSGNIFESSNGGIMKWVNIISQIFSALFYFQGILNSFELSETFYKISKHLTEKMNAVVEYVNIANVLVSTHWNNDISTSFYNTTKAALLSFNFQPKPFTLLSNFGNQLKAFRTIDLKALKHLICNTYVIDSIYTISLYKKTHQACYCEYQDGVPTIDAGNMWHPCIPNDIVIKNDIVVSNKNNAIITGPNAGGKSTFIKALLVNTILGQTIGISLSSSFRFTPFSLIHSQINLPDTKGKESLFEAEMYRCKKILEVLKESNSNVLIVMDEIFNSTNPVEGIAGAYAIVKKISDYKNSAVVFTTHYAYLTKLQKATGRFTNYKMNIEKKEEDIVYLYKLEKGISKQYIALELLALNGFDNDIISEAVAIKKRLTS